MLAFLLILAGGFGQGCLTYGRIETFSGRLERVDEAGYHQFVALRLAEPICTKVDPGDRAAGDAESSRGRSGVRVVQAGVYGGDAAALELRERLERLVGQQVRIRGDVFPQTTGHDRTDINLRVAAVEPVDAAGQQALLAPKQESRQVEVAAYDVTLRAGPRLVIEVAESGTANALLPVERFVRRSMTGAEVLYVNCTEGFEVISASSVSGEAVHCDGSGCGLTAFPKKPSVIRMHCARKP